MYIQKKQSLKKLTYVCLSFTSMILSTEVQARHKPPDEYAVEEGGASSPRSRKENREDEKYNLIGVALFSGKDPFSYAIKKLTHSKISHLGVILSDAQNENRWYCFESTGTAGEVLRGQYPH